MYTDMVGYTALGQRDESLSLTLVEEQRKLVRPIVTRHKGKEVKTIGDSFLIEFASALDATRCAYDIQRATRELNFSLPNDRRIHLRIGIHLGDVEESQGDISGDAVNVASRIESLADDGGVCMTRQVYDHVENKFELPLKTLGPKSLKNVKAPIEVYKMQMPWEEAVVEAAGELDRLRIAVLPLRNMSPDPNDEYFADGMTEELITTLSGVSELTVIARTSVMQYKNSPKRVVDVGKELKTGTVVEGSLRKAGDRVRITVQMIDAGTEGHLWAQNYDRQLSDIFAVQSEIASKVTDALKIRLVSSEKRVMERRPTEDSEAYMLYMKGRYYWNERTEKSLEKAIAYLLKALEIDPNLAVAYSDLADSYLVLADRSFIPSSEAFAKAEAYARKALKLDPRLSQPHADLACIHEGNFRWADAEREYKLAIEMNPNNATAHHWYALDLAMRGKKNSLEEWKKAKELDPLSRIVLAGFGYYLAWYGQTKEGLEMLKSVLEIDETDLAAHLYLSWVYMLEGMKTEALKEAKRLLDLGEGGVNIMASAACVYAKAGLKREAKAILDRIFRKEETHYIDPFRIAMVYSAMGDESNVFRWLEKAVAEKSQSLAYLRIFPWFKPLWDNPRFRQIAAQIGL